MKNTDEKNVLLEFPNVDFSPLATYGSEKKIKEFYKLKNFYNLYRGISESKVLQKEREKLIDDANILVQDIINEASETIQSLNGKYFKSIDDKQEAYFHIKKTEYKHSLCLNILKYDFNCFGDEICFYHFNTKNPQYAIQYTQNSLVNGYFLYNNSMPQEITKEEFEGAKKKFMEEAKQLSEEE